MKEVVAGIDIGGTNTITGIVDRDGNILAGAELKTTDFPEVGGFLDALVKQVRELTGKGMKLAGIGIGAPNGNFHRGTIEMAPNLQWKGIVPVAEMMKERSSVKVALTNDANAAALGEMMFGGAKGMNDFIVLTLGTGLGSGIVSGGNLLYGHTGFAGEYGHVTMVPGGRDCGCGRQGCLETYVSATGIVRTAQWMLTEMSNPSPLRNYRPSELTSRIIAEAALAGDPVALESFDYTAEMLALAIVNAVVVTSPEAIFLFGGLANAGDLILKPTREYAARMIQPVFAGTFEIRLSELNQLNAAVLGSAALAWKEL